MVAGEGFELPHSLKKPLMARVASLVVLVYTNFIPRMADSLQVRYSIDNGNLLLTATSIIPI